MSGAPACVGGLYEACVGVPDLAAAIADFERYGCRVGRLGELDGAAARSLYGHDSPLRSARLMHQDADHGLLRLMQWERPRNTGLGTGPDLRCIGSRWGVRLTASVMNIANHAQRALETGAELTLIEPILAVIGEVTGERAAVPFRDPLVGVREMVLLQPHYRQVFFERFGYDSPLYGRINPRCLFMTSQHTHFGMMIVNDDHRVLDFYDQVLGLKRWFDTERPWEQATGSRRIFGLEEGETHWMVDFDDPRSGPALAERRSGKLKVVRFGRGSRLPDLMERSRPGCLGFSLYTWQVRDIEGMHRRVQSAGARDLSDVLADEFGTRSFGFTAPDGYPWMLVEAP